MSSSFNFNGDNIRLTNKVITEQKLHVRTNVRRTAPLSGARKQREGAMTLFLEKSSPISPINSVLGSSISLNRRNSFIRDNSLDFLPRKGVVFVSGKSGVTPFLSLKSPEKTGLSKN